MQQYYQELDSSFTLPSNSWLKCVNIAVVNILVKIDEQTYYHTELTDITTFDKINNESLTIECNNISPTDLNRLLTKSNEYKIDVIEIWEDENKQHHYFTYPSMTYKTLNIHQHYYSNTHTWELTFEN